MPGKPFQSKLIPYEEELFALLDAGESFRKTAEAINAAHGPKMTHNAVFSFAKSRRRRRGARLFYEGLSADLRDHLLKQVAAVWTHDSTAIEGNTLTLGGWPKPSVGWVLKRAGVVVGVTELVSAAAGLLTYLMRAPLYPAAWYPGEITVPLLVTQSIQVTCYLTGALCAGLFLLHIAATRLAWSKSGASDA